MGEPQIWTLRALGLGSRLGGAHSGKEEIQHLEEQLCPECLQTFWTGNQTTEVEETARARTALSLRKVTENGETRCAQRQANSCARRRPRKEEHLSLQRPLLLAPPLYVPPLVTTAGNRLPNASAIRSRTI